MSALLLTGAPGVGKRTVARWLAGELGVDLLWVSASALAAAQPGESAVNLRSAFALARTRPCVMMLDVLGVAGRRRIGSHRTAGGDWLSAVLLNELDTRPQELMVAAATARLDLLDREITRRFDAHIHLDLPGNSARVRLLTEVLSRAPVEADRRVVRACGAATAGFTPGDLHRMASAAVRTTLVAGESAVAGRLARACVAAVGSRAPEAEEALDAFCALANREAGLSIRELSTLLGSTRSKVFRRVQRWEAGLRSVEEGASDLGTGTPTAEG